MQINRREFSRLCTVAAAGFAALDANLAVASPKFQPNYLLGSCLYGYMYLGEILPEVRDFIRAS